MHSSTLYSIALLSIVTWMTSLHAHADIVQFNTSMENDWWDAVDDVTTIDFTGFENFEVLTDEYSDLGVTFSNPSNGIVTFFETGLFVNDDWGLRGFNGAWIHFDQPMNWISANHPGTLAYELYNGDELIATSFILGGTGSGHFSGLISSVPFDGVFLWKFPSGPTQEFVVFVDDLHFGAIPAPGALGVYGMALLFNRRRRRS